MRIAVVVLLAFFAIQTNGQPSSCYTDTHAQDKAMDIRSLKSTVMDTISIHLFVSHDLYMALGSSENEVTQYIRDLVAQVNLIYNLHLITIELADLTIWTELDPYNLSNLHTGLASFSAMHHQTHIGHLAHLLTSTDAYVGGKSFLRGLCDDQKSFGISTVSGELGSIWEYSWDVHILAHEIGHNLGSQHTHDCVWGPNGDIAIDGCSINHGCGDAPIPTNGGTVMSYCQGHPSGIDFSLGLGEEPAVRIKNYIATCLPKNGEACTEAQHILVDGPLFIEDISTGSGASRDDASHAKWYVFVPEVDGTIDIQSCHQGVDTRLNIYTGDCEDLLLIYESDDNCMSGDGFNYASQADGLTVLALQQIFIEWDDRWSQEGFTWIFDFSPDGLGCNDDKAIPAVVESSLAYNSLAPIDYDGHLTSEADVKFSSIETIELTGGFTIEAGALFEVLNEGCSED